MGKFKPVFDTTIDVETKNQIENGFKKSYEKHKEFFDGLKNNVEVHFNKSGFPMASLIDGSIDDMKKIKLILSEFLPT